MIAPRSKHREFEEIIFLEFFGLDVLRNANPATCNIPIYELGESCCGYWHTAASHWLIVLRSASGFSIPQLVLTNVLHLLPSDIGFSKEY